MNRGFDVSDDRLVLRQKSREDIVAEEQETIAIMTGDQEAALKRASDYATARKSKKEDEEEKKEEPEIELPDEWFLESEKRSYRGYVETDNSMSDSKYVLMVCKENNGEREFIVMDVHDKWYKFEPMIRTKKQTLTAVELEKQRKENLRKVSQKLNKLDFVKAAQQRAKQEEQAQIEIEKRVKSERPENMDYDDEWSDDEGYVAPDLDRDEKLDQDREALIEYFDDVDEELRDEDDNPDAGATERRRATADDLVKQELGDEEHELDKKSKKRKADRQGGKGSKRRRTSDGSGNLADQLRDFIEEHGGKVKMTTVLKSFIRSEDPQARRDELKAALAEVCVIRKEGKDGKIGTPEE